MPVLEEAALGSLSQSEQRYRQLFQYMPISLWQLDARALRALFKEIVASGVTDLSAYMDEHPGFVTHVLGILMCEEVNDVTIKMFGAASAQEFVGPTSPYFKTRPDTIRRAMESRFRGEPVFEERTQVDTLDGRLIEVLFTAARTPVGTTLAGFVDLTELTRTQRSLEQLQADFARAGRISALGELTAAIAHEVNQPLAAIVSSANAGLRWLGSDPPNVVAAKESFQRIVTAGGLAGGVIKRLRSMLQNAPPGRELLDVNDAISEAISLVRGDAARHGISVHINLARDAPLVRADRVQVQQVVLNLFLNAVEAMTSAARPRVLSIKSAPVGTGGVIVTVADTGMGFSGKDPLQLFEAFYTTKPQGTGMGLAISRTIIQSHGGELAALDNPPRGAIFQFTLPAEGGESPAGVV